MLGPPKTPRARRSSVWPRVLTLVMACCSAFAHRADGFGEALYLGQRTASYSEPILTQTGDVSSAARRQAKDVYLEFDGTNWWRLNREWWNVVTGTRTNITRERLSGFSSTNTLTDATEGGDENGANLRATSYQVNSLNQYATNSNPAQVQIVGAATATASVTVNGAAAYERLEYFHEELTTTNSNPVVLPVMSIASLSGTYATNSGSLLIHPATQVFKYDADGNLTNDLVWEYFWDAENRLSAIQNTTDVTAAERLRLEFGYTWENKRFAKKVFAWDTSTTDWFATPTNHLVFLYDRWKLIAEIDNSDPETA